MNRPPDRYDGPPPDVVYPSPVPPAPAITAESLRARVLEIAAGEVGSNDAGRYFAAAAPCYPTAAARRGKSWCQIFVLWCLRRACVTDRVWRDRTGVFGAPLRVTRAPQPADVLIIPWSKGGSHVEHGCLFRRREGSRVWTFDGNTTGGFVRAKDRDLRIYSGQPQRPYFVDLDPWFAEAVERLRMLESADTEPPGAA